MKFNSYILEKIPKKFLIVGFINTIFGYFIGILNYKFLYDLIGIIGVGILNSILSITFAFIMMKLFVFKTVNTNWLFEYLRSYLVYGTQALIGVAALWLCIKVFLLNIYFSQAIAVLTTVFLSYLGHKNFTFKV